MLKVTNISKRYGDKWILRDVSFETAAGSIFGVLGATGCGKSILLKILAGNEKPNSGSISFYESDVTSSKPNFALFTANPNSLEKRKFWSKGNETASIGEMQIRSFENAITSEADIILLDDPLNAVSKNDAKELLSRLKQNSVEKSKIVILATNDPELAFAYCDEIGVLYRGEFAQTGTPHDLYEEPSSVLVASVMGRNNFIVSRRVTFNNQATQEFQALIGEHRLTIDKTEKSKLGAINANVTLAIRPEHISISTGASFPEDNLLKARIAGVEYLGATTLVKLDANGLMLKAMVMRLVGLEIGDECVVGLPPDRIKILKE